MKTGGGQRLRHGPNDGYMVMIAASSKRHGLVAEAEATSSAPSKSIRANQSLYNYFTLLAKKRDVSKRAGLRIAPWNRAGIRLLSALPRDCEFE